MNSGVEIPQWIGIISYVLAGLGAVITWYVKTRADRQKIELEKLKADNERLIAESEKRKAKIEESEFERESTQLLYEQLELLKKKVILSVAREVDQASEIAEVRRLLIGLQSHCEDCYKTYMAQYRTNDSEGGDNRTGDNGAGGA